MAEFQTKRAARSGLEGVRLVHTTTIALSLDVIVSPGAKFMVEKGLVVCGVASAGEHLESFAKKTGGFVKPIEMKRAVTPLYDFVSLWNLWRFFREFRPRIVHGHTPKGAMLGVVAGALARVPVRIHHVHGLPHVTERGLKRFLLRSSEKIASRFAHRVYFVSPSMMNQAIEEGICPPEKAYCFGKGSSGGVDAEGRFNPERYDREKIRSGLGIAPDETVIGFVGRVVRDKGIFELIRAFNSMRDIHPRLRLLLVGPMEEKDPIPEEIKKQILTDERIIFTGWQSEPENFFAAMDIFAFPSYREGFGAVAIEASAMKIPVVACEIPGCVDAVADKVTGLLVPVRDAAALEAALERYITDPELAKSHGEAGRMRALEEFNPRSIWEAQYEEYEKLLKTKKGGMAEF